MRVFKSLSLNFSHKFSQKQKNFKFHNILQNFKHKSSISKKHVEEPVFPAENQGLIPEPDIEERIYFWLHENGIFSADGKANLPKRKLSGQNFGFSKNIIIRKPSELLEKRRLSNLGLKLRFSETE